MVAKTFIAVCSKWMWLCSRVRASAAVGKASLEVANIAAQALVSDGIGSEFSGDHGDGDQRRDFEGGRPAGAALELINEIGATTPCVNEFDPPYPDAVKATALTEADLGALLDKGRWQPRPGRGARAITGRYSRRFAHAARVRPAGRLRRRCQTSRATRCTG